MEEKIVILSIGEIEEELLSYLKLELEKRFSLPLEIIFEKEEIDYAYNPKRGQFNSSLILERLKGIKKKGELILAIVDKDLYSSGLNFVFGEADMKNKVCLIGLSRLRQEFYGLPSNQKLFFERALKEAVHELGHLFGFGHCGNPDCVMYFSNTLLDTDRKSPNFCEKHKLK